MNGNTQFVFSHSKWIDFVDKEKKEGTKKRSIPNNGTGKAQKTIR